MNKAKINLAVDALALMCFACLASTGIILEYLLPPGSGGMGQGDHGYGAGRPVVLLWNLSRHEWGTIHFWIALVLLAVLAVHLILHWRWIYGMVRGRQTDASGTRLMIGALAFVAMIALACAPLLGTRRSVPRSSLADPATGSDAGTVSAPGAETIRGSMTLGELSESTSVPLEHLKSALKLPEDTKATERLGRLRRDHPFDMEQLRKIVREYPKGH